jgi:hypothetical protein
MKITISITLMLLGIAWSTSRADESLCKTSPYGDSVKSFTRYAAKYAALTPHQMTRPLQIACYAKFVHSVRTALDLIVIHAGGISDTEIASSSTTAIADRWLDAAIALASRLGRNPANPADWSDIPPLPSDAVVTDVGHSTCSVGGVTSGEKHIVYIHASPKSCEKWVGDATLLSGIGPTSEQIQHATISPSQSAVADTRSIYAIFLCIPSTGSCQMYGAPREDSFGNVLPAITFGALSECYQTVHSLGPMSPPVNGRFMLPNGLWYECRRKRVESWEPAR